MAKIELGCLNPKSKKIDKQTVLEFCNEENYSFEYVKHSTLLNKKK